MSCKNCLAAATVTVIISSAGRTTADRTLKSSYNTENSVDCTANCAAENVFTATATIVTRVVLMKATVVEGIVLTTAVVFVSVTYATAVGMILLATTA